MESNELKPGNCYKVFFEKRKPIEFKFIDVDELGNTVCEERTGERFNFNNLEQHLLIKEDEQW